MKLFLTVLSVLCVGCKLNSQINYCDFFGLDIRQQVVNGQKKIFISPIIKKKRGSIYSDFVQKHQNSFLYLLYNRIDSIEKYQRLYLDSAECISQFCQDLNANKRFASYIISMTNPEDINAPKNIFTEREMMQIAARFFLCDRINKADTSIGARICVTVNGQDELKTNRDYTLLEAFCFEVINFHIEEENPPAFFKNKNFWKTRTRIAQNERKNFVNFETHLEIVKNKTFEAMENDPELKNMLINYYETRGQDLGLKIK